MKRVVVITPYVPPNIVNLYKILLQKIGDDNIRLKIFCVKKIPIHRKHEIPNYSELEINFFDGLNFYLPKSEIAIDFPKGMARSLKDFNPNIIIYDGYGIGFISAIIFGLKKKLYKKNIKLVFWNSNTSLKSGPLESSKKKERIFLSFFIRKIKINLMKSFDIFAAGGKSMSDYLLDLKVKQNDITLVPRATFSKGDIQKLNTKYIKDQNQMIKFIFCGEISKRKGVDIILDAVAINTTIFENINIELYGNFKSSEESFFRKKLLQTPKVSYMGWLESDLLIPNIQKSDILLIPSRREPFGRITIEGLSCGAYLLMGDSVGASKDLNKDFLGSTFFNNCPQELYEAMHASILDIKNIRSQRGKRVDWVINNWTHDVSADGLLEIIKRD
jgi:glycosyltransferase involved in cell wall biosynthesis